MSKWCKDHKNEYLLGKIPVEGILCVGEVDWNKGENAKELVMLVKRSERDGLEITY